MNFPNETGTATTTTTTVAYANVLYMFIRAYDIYTHTHIGAEETGRFT